MGVRPVPWQHSVTTTIGGVMGILEDVMKTLERVPGWKRLSGLPAEVDALTERISALEARLAAATGTACPSCRAMRFTLVRSEPEPPPWGDMGAMQDCWECSACGYTDTRKRGTR
jgi:C4-type Zn-finger protein